MNNFIGERLKGPQQWTGWELIAKAEAGEPLARDEQQLLDRLDRMMRGCGYRPAG